MSWGSTDPNRGSWRRCPECKDTYTDYDAHMRLHRDRPSDNHMTVGEVVAATGRSERTVRYWVTSGKLRSVRSSRVTGDADHKSPPRIWITRSSLKAFMRELVERDPVSALPKAVTGG